MRKLNAAALLFFLLWTLGLPPNAQAGQTEETATTAPPKSRLNIPVATVGYWNYGPLLLPGTGDAPDLIFDTRVLRFDGMFGHRFQKTKTTLAGSLHWDYTRARWHTEDIDDSGNYHLPRLRLVIRQAFNEKWGGMGYIMVGIGTDFKRFSTDSLIITAGVAADYKINREWQVSFGAMYTNAFFGDMGLPLLALRYRRDPFRFALLIPRGLELWYTTETFLELGITVVAQSWRFGIQPESTIGDILSQLNIPVSAAARFFLFRGLFAMLSAGYDVQYVQIERNGKTTHELLSFQSWHACFSLGYML